MAVNEIAIKAYNTKELAAMYGVSTKTFSSWLERFQELIGERHGYYFNALQVKIIFEKLGLPGCLQLV
jgi:hypothetical protein